MCRSIQWLERYDKAMRDVNVEAHSSEQFVKVFVRGDGDLDIRIKPGTVRRVGLGLDQERLLANINAAINEAFSRYGNAVQRAYLQAHGISKA